MTKLTIGTAYALRLATGRRGDCAGVTYDARGREVRVAAGTYGWNTYRMGAIARTGVAPVWVAVR